MFRRFNSHNINGLHHIFPPIPFRYEGFKEIKQLFILWILKDQKNGISGSFLYNKYNIPRTNLLRILDELEKKGYVKSKNKVINGKATKLYIITDEGKSYLELLREKWAEKFTFMGLIAPLERFQHPFRIKRQIDKLLKDIDLLKTKEDALDYFRGLRLYFKEVQERINKRLENVTPIIENINDIIKKLESMTNYTPENLKSIIKNYVQIFKNDFSETEVNSEIRFCSNCGAEIIGNAKYCHECGKKL
ncbi:MAG: helix-turn-helix transcriptional regulator [Candidatus Helarchaeota archaeon]